MPYNLLMLTRMLERFGRIPVGVAISVLIGVVSFLLTRVIALIFDLPIHIGGTMISLFLPMAIAFPILLFIFRTISELAEAKARLEIVATTDLLTGVHNRANFIRLAEAALADAPDARPLGLAVIDIDRFKQINDTYGHLAGDQALRLVAETISASLRPDDIFGRFGGDEFILLLPDAALSEMEELCHRLVDEVHLLVVGPETAQTSLSATLGAAAAVPGAISLRELIGRADAALLEAKRLGGSQAICR